MSDLPLFCRIHSISCAHLSQNKQCPCRPLTITANWYRLPDCNQLIEVRVMATLHQDGRFGSKLGQIGPKWDKSEPFSDQISVDFGWVSENVLKSDLKSPGFVPFGPNVTYFLLRDQICHPSLTFFCLDLTYCMVLCCI